jgi:polysaccharide biosynthesis transport protein
MTDDKLPAGPAGPPDHLPAPRGQDHALAAEGRRPVSLDLYSEERRDDADEIDLLAYWRILLKRRWHVLGTLAAVVALALLITLLMPSIYRGTTTVQIDQETMQIVQVEGVTNAAAPTRDYYQTQYELLASRALAERVAEALDLPARLESLRNESWLDRVRGLLRPQARAESEEASAQDQAGSLRSAAGFVLEGLTIEPVRNSQLVRIHFDSRMPELSARVANTLADEYIESTIERKFGASSYARKYLEEQLATTKGRLEQSERALVEFAQREGLVTTGEDGLSLASRNLGDLNSALATAQEQRIRAQARWNQARAARGAALPADMLGNSIIRTLQQQRAQLQGQYQEQLQIYKPDYPSMQQLKGQIDALQAEINRELGNIRASIKAEYDAAAQQESLLKSQLDSLRQQALNVDSRSIDYNILKREADTNRQLYDALLQRYNEVGVAGGVGNVNISVVDRAQVPTSRYKPNLTLNLAIGLLLGLILGVLLALVLEFLDDTLKSPEDIEQKLRMPLLGIIPKLGKQDTPEKALQDPRSAFAESYRSVRTALQFSTDSGVPKVLLLTSAGPSEGKSTSALTLARNFAQLGKRVLLIEADMRNPSLHRSLGARAEVGLSSVLSGAALPTAAIQDTDDDRLKVILAGPLPPNPAELLAGSRLISLLTVAAEKYDQVIIDGPPVLGIADAPILANAAHATLLIVHAGETRVSAAQSAVKRLSAARARLVGAVLSQYDAKASGYGYDYDSYYSYGATPRLGRG